MIALLKTLLVDDRGQDLAEYGIALAVIGLGAGAAAVVIATDVDTLFTSAASILTTAAAI